MWVRVLFDPKRTKAYIAELEVTEGSVQNNLRIAKRSSDWTVLCDLPALRVIESQGVVHIYVEVS
jgi:hypothetical protein